MISGAQLFLMRGVLDISRYALAAPAETTRHTIERWEKYETDNPRPNSSKKILYASPLTLAVVIDPSWTRKMLS